MIKLLAHSCLQDYLALLHVILYHILKIIPNHKSTAEQQRVPSLGVIWIRISDPRSLRSWCASNKIKTQVLTIQHYRQNKDFQWRKASEN